VNHQGISRQERVVHRKFASAADVDAITDLHGSFEDKQVLQTADSPK